MPDKDFERYFKDGLSETQHFHYDEEAWKGVAAALDERDAMRPTAIITFKRLAVAASIFLLLLSNAYFYKRLRHSEQQLAAVQPIQPIIEVEEKMLAAKSPLKPKIDFIKKEKNTNHYRPKISTPTTPIIKEHSTLEQASLEAKKDDNNNIIVKNNIEHDVQKQENKVIIEEVLEENTSVSTTNAIVSAVLPPKLPAEVSLTQQVVLNEAEDDILQPSLEAKAQLFEQTEIQDKKTLFDGDWYAFFLPQDFHIGFSLAKGILPKQVEKKGSKILEGSWSAGIRAELAFSEKLRLQSDIDYMQTSFTAKDIEALGAPPIELPHEFLVLESVAANRSYMEYSLGLKYVLYNARKRFAPYAAASLKAQQGFTQKYSYNYKSTSPLFDDYEKLMRGKEKTFNLNTVHFQLGMEYNLARDLMLQVEGFYNTAISKESAKVPNLLGLKAGIVCVI